MTLALELANRIRGLTADTLPPEAVRWAKVGILDTVGVTLAGAREPCATIARSVSPSLGKALVFGTPDRLGTADAAFVNGTASHALDFDDCSNSLGGHPSAPVLPALFALAEEIDASGRDFVAAYVAGFETETRIARAVNFHHYEKGWHPTATLGVFGAAAACAHLLKLPSAQIATALSVAASFASGIKANFGTMTKPLHVGHATRDGLVAALLARGGFTAGAEAFEHPQGFFMVFNGVGHFDAPALLRDWAAPLDILSPGIAIKQYPCCGSTHPAIDAMLALVAQHDVHPEEVARVVAWTHPRRLRHTNRPAPRSALDAKFSVQYCLARALAERCVVLSHFDGDAYAEPAIRQLMSRIEAIPQPDAASSINHFGAEVTLFTIDGRRLSHRVESALGRTTDNPLPQPRLEAKFLDCARGAIGVDAAQRIGSLIAQFDELSSLSGFFNTLADGAASRQSRQSMEEDQR